MWLYPDGSAVYRVTSLGDFFFKPTKRTIILWCADCWHRLGYAEKAMEKKTEELGDALAVQHDGLPEGFAHPRRVDEVD